MAWSAPTNAAAFPINDLANLLKCKMHAYVAFGEIEADEIPESMAELSALLSGAGQKFVPLGDLHKDPIVWKADDDVIEMHEGSVPGGVKFSGEIKIAALDKTGIEMMDLEGWDDSVTILLLPFNMPAAATALAPVTIVFLAGVSVVDKGDGNGNNQYGMITLALSADVENREDVIKYVVLTA